MKRTSPAALILVVLFAAFQFACMAGPGFDGSGSTGDNRSNSDTQDKNNTSTQNPPSQTAPDTGATPPASGSTPPAQQPTAPKAQSLSSSSFVHLKEVGKDTYHLMVFDLSTRTSTKIFDFDGKSFSSPPHIKVSPDRKWVAFTARFRQSSSDLSDTHPIQSLWVIGIDGSGLRRVTTPYSETVANADRTGRSMTYPQWSHDGRSLYVRIIEFESDSMGNLSNHDYVLTVPFTGGALRPVPSVNPGCAKTGIPSLHPTKPLLVAHRSKCQGDTEGLAVYNLQTGESRLLKLQQQPHTLYTNFDQPVWLVGGNLLIKVKANWDLDYDGTPDVAGEGYWMVDIDSGRVTPLIPPTQTQSSISRLSVSPDGTKLVAEMFNESDRSRDLFLADSKEPQKGLQRLTSDGKNLYPNW